MFKKLPRVFVCFVLVSFYLCSIVFAQGGANSGEIKAKILNVEDKTPLEGRVFWLFPVGYKNGEMFATVGFDYESKSDSEGRVHFKNIKPGTYIISCSMCTRIEDKKGNLLVFEIKKGGMGGGDLGTVYVKLTYVKLN